MDFERDSYLEFLKREGRQIAAAVVAGDFLASRIISLIPQARKDDDPVTWGLLMSAIDDWKARHEAEHAGN
jgi:hypothetical protein